MNSAVSKTLATSAVDFVVIGGGVSGLSAAFYLRRFIRKEGKEPKIVVIEGSKRLGGWIHSTRTKEGGVHELGPRSMRPAGLSGKNALNLACSLGLNHLMIPVLRSHPAARKRFIYANGKLNTLPNSVTAILRKQDPLSKPLLSYIWKEPFIAKSNLEDESVYDFFHRRLGKEITEYMVDALCRGIYAGNARELSIRSCFPLLHQYEQQHGSLIRGGLQATAEQDPTVVDDNLVARAERENWSVWSLQGGLQTLIDKLERRLRIDGVEIHTGETCAHLQFTNEDVDEENNEDVDEENKVALITAGGNRWKTSNVISCIPAQSLAQLLEDDHVQLATYLRHMKAATVATVNLEYEGSMLKDQGFGYLVPSNQPDQVLGVVFDSCSMPQLNRSGAETTRLTCMMGGAWFYDLFGDPNDVDTDHLLSVAMETVKDHLGIGTTPIYTAVNVQQDCIPNYQVGHHKLLDDIDAYIADQSLPLTLLGASYRGVSVNDCIYQAKKAVQRLQSR